MDEVDAYNKKCAEISVAHEDLETILNLCNAEYEKLSPEGKKIMDRASISLGRKVLSQMGIDYKDPEK